MKFFFLISTWEDQKRFPINKLNFNTRLVFHAMSVCQTHTKIDAIILRNNGQYEARKVVTDN